MKISYLMLAIIYMASWAHTFGQEIEKMDKKELRLELSNRLTEIDSIMNVNLSLQSEITKHKNRNDSLIHVLKQTRLLIDIIEAENISIKTKIIDLDIQNKELVRKIETIKDSLVSSNNEEKNTDYIRELIINKYLRNKTFKITYYNSHDGTGPDGGSFSSIAEINDKYYIGDISNGGEQTVRLADNTELSYCNSWILIIKDNLEFSYKEGDKIVQGNISYKPIKWLDFIQSDSTYLSSLITNEDQLKLPIGFAELETIRGPYDFMIYFLVGEKTYWFNGKKYQAFNSIILESNNVEIIMSQTN